jgi:hypothetical protein
MRAIFSKVIIVSEAQEFDPMTKDEEPTAA